MFQKRYKKLFLALLVLFSFLAFSKIAYAQMMGGIYPSVTPSAQDIKEISEGKNLFNSLKNNKITCSNLKDDDFERIGEYVMDQQIGDFQKHVQMNLMMKQMMGEKGEENMHISLGRQVAGCTDSGKGGFTNMMGWGYGNMMGGFGLVGTVMWIVLLIDLTLLGVWLWKQINKK